MRRIIDDLEIMSRGYGPDGGDIAGKPIDVGGKDGAGLGSNGRFDLVGINGQVTRANINKDRRGSGV